MEHPLDGAYARLARAEEHIAELEGIIRLFLDEELRHVVGTIHFDTEPTPGFTLRGASAERPAPPRIGLLIGETIQGIRAALDYLVFELAKHHEKGIEQDGTQFPIESTDKGWKGRMHSYLRHVCPVHITIIEGLQPRYGCNWSGLIATLSNRDKHRTIVASLRQMEVRMIAFDQQTDFGPIQILSDRVIVRFYRGGTVEVETHITLLVACEGKVEIVQQLRDVVSHVRDTLDQFHPEFERQPAPDCQFGYPGHRTP